MSRIQCALGVLAIVLAGLAIWQLESMRSGIAITPLDADGTPATVYRQPEASGPIVVIAHGFAGSRQLMEAFALTLARAGYTAVSFDFQGHGQNPMPMSGDVTRLDGTTRNLVAETSNVIDAALALTGDTGQVALLGHSMATDIIVRQAKADPRVAAVVAVSMHSDAVTDRMPERLLVITGEWEPGLRSSALDTLRLVQSDAKEGETVDNVAIGVRRRAVVAPTVEHVGVLYSTTSLSEARNWLDAVFGRESSGDVAATGGWVILLLASIVLLARPLASLLPVGPSKPTTPSLRTFLAASLLPAVLTPLVLSTFRLQILPVLVADYLVLHLLLYGLISLSILYWRGIRLGPIALTPTIALVAFGLCIFGVALDRYVASFLPHSGRIVIILAIAVGAVPFMLADSLLVEAGRARVWRRLFSRTTFLVSLGLAVALDFERLFFLVIVLPVIVLFFLVFGSMGGWVGRRTGNATVQGTALGIILAWSIGVSFPLVAG